VSWLSQSSMACITTTEGRRDHPGARPIGAATTNPAVTLVRLLTVTEPCLGSDRKWSAFLISRLFGPYGMTMQEALKPNRWRPAEAPVPEKAS